MLEEAKRLQEGKEELIGRDGTNISGSLKPGV